MTQPLTPTSWQSTASPISGDPQVFPILDGASLWALKAPNWSSIRKVAASGRSVASTNQAYPIWRFRVRYELIRERTSPSNLELSRLFAFFNAYAGSAGSFFLQDPYDNAVTDQAVGTGDGATASFQLGRTLYPAGALPFFEPIYCVRGTPVVKVAGVASLNFSLGDQGVITFTPGHIPTLGQAITWTGGYLFWVHFVEDAIEPEQMFSDIWSLDGLELESMKP